MEPATQTVGAVGDNFGALGGFLGGLAQAAGVKSQAKALQREGELASAQSNEREEQMRREARQQLGEQVADIAQSGIGFTATTRDTMDQSATNASLDALNVRYDGLVKRLNYENQATQLRHKAAAMPFIGAINGAAKALSMVGGYTGAGVMPPAKTPALPPIGGPG